MSNYINKFDEFGPGMGFPKMSEYFEEKPYDGIEKIINYLQNGKKTYVSVRKSKDVYSGEIIPIELCGMTDGEYSWISSLCYYVKKYNLRLPKDFEKKVLSL